MIALLVIAFALGCFALGMYAGRRLAGRRSGRPAFLPVPERAGAPAQPVAIDPADVPGNAIALLGQALRDPLQRLRRLTGIPVELTAHFERVAWQARMLAAGARPMQALPCSPVSLLEEAAQEVETLRLGKVQASWTLLTRQPVHVDPERTRSAFRELLTAAAGLAGEAGRVALRITPSELESHPVRVEIEIGRRGAEMDPLAAVVARHLLEAQGALFEVDGPLVRVRLRSQRAEPLSATRQTPSNR